MPVALVLGGASGPPRPSIAVAHFHSHRHIPTPPLSIFLRIGFPRTCHVTTIR